MDTFANHPSDEVLEAYSRDKLSESDKDHVEDHLLLCEDCQVRFQETDEFVHSIKLATHQLREKEFFRSQQPSYWQRFVGLLVTRSVWVTATITAAAAVILAVPMWRSSITGIGYQDIALSSLRGIDSGIQPNSDSWLRLKLDLQRLPGMKACFVTIVDNGGRSIWRSGELHPQDANVSITLDRKLASGVYWVRLAPSPEAPPLREYALKVK